MHEQSFSQLPKNDLQSTGFFFCMSGVHYSSQLGRLRIGLEKKKKTFAGEDVQAKKKHLQTFLHCVSKF